MIKNYIYCLYKMFHLMFIVQMHIIHFLILL